MKCHVRSRWRRLIELSRSNIRRRWVWKGCECGREWCMRKKCIKGDVAERGCKKSTSCKMRSVSRHCVCSLRVLRTHGTLETWNFGWVSASLNAPSPARGVQICGNASVGSVCRKRCLWCVEILALRIQLVRIAVCIGQLTTGVRPCSTSWI